MPKALTGQEPEHPSLPSYSPVEVNMPMQRGGQSKSRAEQWPTQYKCPVCKTAVVATNMNSHIRLNKAHRRSYNAAISRGERIADLWIPYPGGMKAAVAQKGSNKTVFSRGIMVELGNSYTGKSFFEIYQGVKLKPDPASAAAAAQGAAIRNTRMLHNASDALKDSSTSNTDVALHNDQISSSNSSLPHAPVLLHAPTPSLPIAGPSNYLQAPLHHTWALPNNIDVFLGYPQTLWRNTLDASHCARSTSTPGFNPLVHPSRVGVDFVTQPFNVHMTETHMAVQENTATYHQSTPFRGLYAEHYIPATTHADIPSMAMVEPTPEYSASGEAGFDWGRLFEEANSRGSEQVSSDDLAAALDAWDKSLTEQTINFVPDMHAIIPSPTTEDSHNVVDESTPELGFGSIAGFDLNSQHPGGGVLSSYAEPELQSIAEPEVPSEPVPAPLTCPQLNARFMEFINGLTDVPELGPGPSASSLSTPDSTAPFYDMAQSGSSGTSNVEQTDEENNLPFREVSRGDETSLDSPSSFNDGLLSSATSPLSPATSPLSPATPPLSPEQDPLEAPAAATNLPLFLPEPVVANVDFDSLFPHIAATEVPSASLAPSNLNPAASSAPYMVPAVSVGQTRTVEGNQRLAIAPGDTLLVAPTFGVHSMVPIALVSSTHNPGELWERWGQFPKPGTPECSFYRSVLLPGLRRGNKSDHAIELARRWYRLRLFSKKPEFRSLCKDEYKNLKYLFDSGRPSSSA